jgi:hypothetical protein
MGAYLALVLVSLILLGIGHSIVRCTKRYTPRTRTCPPGRDSPAEENLQALKSLHQELIESFGNFQQFSLVNIKGQHEPAALQRRQDTASGSQRSGTVGSVQSKPRAMNDVARKDN